MTSNYASCPLHVTILPGSSSGTCSITSIFDGVASIAIGLLLKSVAGILALRTQGLLLGEGVNPEELADIRRRVDADLTVKSAGDILTMYMCPHDLLVNMGVCFAAEITAEQMHEAIHRIQADLQSAYPEINRVYIEAESLSAKAIE